METPTPPPATVSNPSLTEDEKLWAGLAHFSGLLSYCSGIGHIVGPLVILLWKGDSSAFVATEAREALNFNISFTIYALICFFFCIIFIGFFMLPVVLIFHVVCVIVAGLRGLEGRPYRYPATIRLVK